MSKDSIYFFISGDPLSEYPEPPSSLHPTFKVKCTECNELIWFIPAEQETQKPSGKKKHIYSIVCWKCLKKFDGCEDEG